jgi:hypothetical protein
VRLTGVMVGAIRDEHHPRRGARYELPTDALPALGNRLTIERQVRSELVPIARQMKQNRCCAARSLPTGRVTRGPMRSTVTAPKNRQRKAKAGGDFREYGWVSKRIRTVKHRRRSRAEPSKHATAGEKVSNDGFTARDELVGKDEPWTRLEPSISQQFGELFGSFGADREIVLDENRLTVEQEALATVRRNVEEGVDQRDEPLPKAIERMVPLTIPVRVRNDVNVERHPRAIRR